MAGRRARRTEMHFILGGPQQALFAGAASLVRDYMKELDVAPTEIGNAYSFLILALLRGKTDAVALAESTYPLIRAALRDFRRATADLPPKKGD